MNRGAAGKPPLHRGAVHEFARNMAGEIVQAIHVEMEDFGGFGEKDEKPSVIETASREVREEPERAALPPPTLPRSGLPILGSLDYPDAPPPTPLLPEMQNNRQSFTRKLKGGLAKEFSPSPPPPTPKEGRGPPHFDSKVELIQHLMRSLSADESGKRSAAAGRNERIAAFAEALSWDVLQLARDEVGERLCAELLATQMANAIVECSLDEATHC